MTVGMPVPLYMAALATKFELNSKPHWLYGTLTTAVWVRLRVTGEGEAGHQQHQSSVSDRLESSVYHVHSPCFSFFHMTERMLVARLNSMINQGLPASCDLRA